MGRTPGVSSARDGGLLESIGRLFLLEQYAWVRHKSDEDAALKLEFMQHNRRLIIGVKKLDNRRCICEKKGFDLCKLTQFCL